MDLPVDLDLVEFCRICGQPAERGTLTTRGNHLECGVERALRQKAQLRDREGPYYERWRKGYLAAADALRNA